MFDGWSNIQAKSLWNFIILTSEWKEYLYALKDFSLNKHTADFLFSEINIIIQEIGIEKFAAIVLDNAVNYANARKQILNKYSHIFNIKCIAHYFNLIFQDIIKHSFANKLINYCNTLVIFFKKSVIAG